MFHFFSFPFLNPRLDGKTVATDSDSQSQQGRRVSKIGIGIGVFVGIALVCVLVIVLHNGERRWVICVCVLLFILLFTQLFSDLFNFENQSTILLFLLLQFVRLRFSIENHCDDTVVNSWEILVFISLLIVTQNSTLLSVMLNHLIFVPYPDLQ